MAAGWPFLMPYFTAHSSTLHLLDIIIYSLADALHDLCCQSDEGSDQGIGQE
jgi:hypothetical protein